MLSLLDTHSDIHQKELDSIFLDMFLPLQKQMNMNFFLEESAWNSC